MSDYRYLLCDLLTDRPLADLPLSGVRFDRRLCRTGSLSGTLSAPTSRLVEVARLCHDYAGRSALWVFRGSQIWWGGIVWTARPKQGPRGPVTLDVQAATFDSYAHHRELYADKHYAQTDQGVIIPDLWRTIQAVGSGNIGVVAADQPTGVLRDRDYFAYDKAKVGTLIEQIGDVDGGPEHTIDTYLDGTGSRVKVLRVADRIGLTVPRAVFQRASRGGGRVQTWEHAADAVDGGTSFQTRGAAPDGNVGDVVPPMLSARVDRTDLLAAGWPRLDRSQDYPDVSVQGTLDDHAAGMAAMYGGALLTSGYEVEVGNTGWSPARLGDAVRIKLRDDWHTTGVDVVARPVGCEVTPGEKGRPETVKLLFGDDS